MIFLKFPIIFPGRIAAHNNVFFFLFIFSVEDFQGFYCRYFLRVFNLQIHMHEYLFFKELQNYKSGFFGKFLKDLRGPKNISEGQKHRFFYEYFSSIYSVGKQRYSKNILEKENIRVTNMDFLK